MILYHATTEKKAKRYRETGAILRPVRGFNTMEAALAWSVKTGRKVIYAIVVDDERTHMLPDHHNKFGNAYWVDHNVLLNAMQCVFSADVDA